MESLGGEDTGQRASVRQVVFASLIGTTIEWYDFFVYGTAAALVFNQLFFPNVDPVIGTLAAFATFGVGFIARPLGGIVFGHYGDKIGRKSMLVITLLIMGVATTLIGLLPTFDAIGIWAPILLVVLRFLQGLSVAETARVMNKNDGAIKALQYRAIRSLGRLLPEGVEL